MLKAIFPLTLLLVSSLCSAEGISGFWQHPKDPVWIEVTSTAGNGLAVRNDNDPSSIGFAVLKEVTVGEQKGRWTGQVFRPTTGELQARGVVLTHCRHTQDEGKDWLFDTLFRMDPCI
jgi:hypothetical protein